jgi:hypothetical protein
MKRQVALLHLLGLFALGNETLINLPADTWYSVPNSKMKAVCITPSPGGVVGCEAIISAWNGGVYDPNLRKMIIWGGGHDDYHGNEVYAFNIVTLKWERMTDPSPIGAFNVDPLPDGKPASRHTYDGLAYVDHAKKMFAYGGARARDGFGTEVTWTFDPSTKGWDNRVPAGNLNRPSANCCNFSGDYDRVTKKVLMRDPNYVTAYDYDKNEWTRLMPWTHSWGAVKSVVVPNRRLFFTFGQKEFLVYDIDKNKDVSADWKTTGGDAVIDSYGMGGDYDIKADALVAWKGGGPYALDMGSKTWTRKSGTGAPAEQREQGTYGRFRYIPEYNVFILVNSVHEDVVFYKHTAGNGAKAPVGARTKALEGRGGGLEVNPSGDKAHIRVPSGNSTVAVTITDSDGRVVDGFQTEAGRTHVWSPGKAGLGVYFAKARVQGRTYSQRFVLGG